jgi:hypothetical protein
MDPLNINNSILQPQGRNSGHAASSSREEAQAPRDSVSISKSGKGRSGKPARSAKKPSSTSAPVPPQKKKDWTVLVYAAADNDLEKHIVKNVADLERIISKNPDFNAVVQLDRGENPSNTGGKWPGTRRIHLCTDKTAARIDSPALEDMGHVNMADPGVLQDFIQWGMKSFPARHYMLVVSDHGLAWKGAIQDFSHNGKEMMSISDMKDAILDAEKNAGKKLDILCFDACDMAQAEVAYEMRETAGYLVASQDILGKEGLPYRDIFNPKVINDKKFRKPKELAKYMVDASSWHQKAVTTLSAVELARMEDLAGASKNLAKAILNSDTPPEVFRQDARAAQSFDGFKDYYDFCDYLAQNEEINDGGVKKAAKAVISSITRAVIAEQHEEDCDPAYGLTIYLPDRKDPKIGDKYKKTTFARDTGWDQVVNIILSGRNSQDPPQKA